jgi:hypothetical protein
MYTGKSYHPNIHKELEVMDNVKPREPIPRSPHVTLWGLCTSIYVLRYSLGVLWIVRILNSSTISEGSTFFFLVEFFFIYIEFFFPS